MVAERVAIRARKVVVGNCMVSSSGSLFGRCEGVCASVGLCVAEYLDGVFRKGDC